MKHNMRFENWNIGGEKDTLARYLVCRNEDINVTKMHCLYFTVFIQPRYTFQHHEYRRK